MKNINKNSLYKIFDWFAFICLFGLSVYLMENVLQEYTKRETSLLISEESLHELPTVTLCFQSILGKIEPALHISPHRVTKHHILYIFLEKKKK